MFIWSCSMPIGRLLLPKVWDTGQKWPNKDSWCLFISQVTSDPMLGVPDLVNWGKFSICHVSIQDLNQQVILSRSNWFSRSEIISLAQQFILSISNSFSHTASHSLTQKCHLSRRRSLSHSGIHSLEQQFVLPIHNSCIQTAIDTIIHPFSKSVCATWYRANANRRAKW